MTILCSGNCHVWLGSSSLCTCEAHRVAMYGLPVNYNPFGPHAPQPATAPRATFDVPLHQFHAAQQSGASHLSADGQRVYCTRYGDVLQARWNEWEREYGAWEVVAEMAEDAVRL